MHICFQIYLPYLLPPFFLSSISPIVLLLLLFLDCSIVLLLLLLGLTYFSLSFSANKTVEETASYNR